MTIEDFNYYSAMAERLFAFMNGKVNILNSNCHLIIDMYDFVTKTYAGIRYPNYITIFIGSIVDSYDLNKYGKLMTKDEYIGTTISWTLCHELYHADQLISMIMYKVPEYKLMIEQQVDQASHNWVFTHSDEISAIGGFKCSIKKLTSSTLTGDISYKRASIKQYYLQTIANIIIRDLEVFYSIKAFTDDTLYDNIVLLFNGVEEVTIKSNGKYIEESIPAFNELTYKYAGFYDAGYSLNIDEYKTMDNSSTAIMKISIKNQLTNGIIFAD